MYNVSATFDVFDLSPFDASTGLGTNPSQEERNDEDLARKSINSIQAMIGLEFTN